MEWLKLIYGFFMANLLGYGGGPSSIPLMYEEIVPHYGWLNDEEFSNMLALGNALPGPIATKIAAYVGYDVYGWLGLSAALAATVLPSAAALIILLGVMQKYKHSPVVKGMTLLVQCGDCHNDGRPDFQNGQRSGGPYRHLADADHCRNCLLGYEAAEAASRTRDSCRFCLWRAGTPV